MFIARGPETALKRMSEIKFNSIILSTSDVVEALKIRGADPAFMEGVYFTDWPPRGDFEHRFQEKYGEPPILESASHYEALHAVVLAAKRNKESLAEEIRKIAFDGVEGRIDFSKSRAGNQATAKLFQVRGGHWGEVSN